MNHISDQQTNVEMCQNINLLNHKITWCNISWLDLILFFFIIKLLNYERQTKELILAQFYHTIASILFFIVIFHYRIYECLLKTKKSFDEWKLTDTYFSNLAINPIRIVVECDGLKNMIASLFAKWLSWIPNQKLWNIIV